ncbi:uncharacterized protein LOC120074072 [Benincasa hispida]|uniref:uncharacterized protein LOC120074072 n=1 Tax=Benincasa hispida TaxID=102211 RepID=UPI001900BFAD|nr:uncharacterized protein LOC120074072 [Benincasa hispida]
MSHSSLDFARDFFLTMSNFFHNFKVQTKYGTQAGAAASGFIISGIGLVLIYVFTQIIKEKNDQRVFIRSISMGALHDGKLAMKRLLQYHKMRATPKKKNTYLEKFEKLINTDTDRPNFPKLQSILAKLEMIGQEDKAIEILKRAAREARENSRPYHEYEYQMLLVEALIYKGNFAAAEKVPCLNNNDASDVRRSLYKAIIQLLLNNTQKAEEEWEEFKNMRSHFLLPPDVKDSQFHTLLADFQSFKQVVNVLKKDIFEKQKAK